MALPELFANPSTPGTSSALTTLGAAVSSTSATTITTAAAAPVALQASGQFRILVDSELMIVTGGAATTTWTVTRGAEGSTAATHANAASVWHTVTSGALGGQSDAAAGVPSLRSLGSGAQQAMAGNGPFSPVNLVTTAANPVLANKLASGDANPTFQINGDGSLHFGAGGASAPDATIARSGANTLQVTGSVNTTGNVVSQLGQTAQMISGYDAATGGQAASFSLGSNPGDTVIRRTAAAIIGAGYATATQVQLGLAGPAGASGITFQNSEAGSNLYREAAGKLRCDGVLHSDLQTLVASVTTARTGGAAAAPPAAPVKYLALQDETGARVYVAAYS